MNVRLIRNKEIMGTSSKFNTSALAEVIVNFDDGDCDSMYIKDLEVFISKNLQFLSKKEGKEKWTPIGHWMLMNKAFKNHDLIIDNYNTCFFEPENDEEKKKGYRLTERDLAVLKAESYD